MIFLDTSAIFALADANDPNHAQALRLLAHANDNDEEILVHNYILVEAAALMQRRLGLAVVLRFLQQVQQPIPLPVRMAMGARIQIR